MKNAAMNNCIQFLGRHVFFSLYISYTYVYILYVYNSGIASLHGNYEKLLNCFPMWVDNFTVQPALYEGFNFSSTLQKFIIHSFDTNHHTECEVIAHCGLDLHFANG